MVLSQFLVQGGEAGRRADVFPAPAIVFAAARPASIASRSSGASGLPAGVWANSARW
jgi:hypothetical protein